MFYSSLANGIFNYTFLCFQIPNGSSETNAKATTVVAGATRYCGRFFHYTSASTSAATVCSKSTKKYNNSLYISILLMNLSNGFFYVLCMSYVKYLILVECNIYLFWSRCLCPIVSVFTLKKNQTLFPGPKQKLFVKKTFHMGRCRGYKFLFEFKVEKI